jgi:hypothetical protein
MSQLNLLDIPGEPGSEAPAATATASKPPEGKKKEADKKPQAAAVAASAGQMSAASVAAARAASAEPDLSQVDPATITRILVVSEGREIPLGIDPAAVSLQEVARWALANKDTAQRLAARVLGTSASHVAGAINVTITRRVRENPEGGKDLLIEAVKVPGYKGGYGGAR